MRGIFAPFLTLGLALLLAQPSSAQNVTIDLTPITYPIVLPDSGGSFDYLLTVTNQGGSPITAAVWCMATLPNGSSWGPALGPVTQTLGAWQTQSYYRIQNVPPRAAYGYFTLHGYVGIYPDTVWAQDSFEFQHQAISGTEQEWVARYNGPGNGVDYARLLALDGNGNVYVTGESDGGSYQDYATLKYDSSGNQIWVTRYSGLANASDRAYSLAVDADGNIYVTGESGGIGPFWNYDYATVKYGAEGNQLWVTRYNGPGHDDDGAYSLAVDDGGNVYVTGRSVGGGTFYDYATVKYDASGNQLWCARYHGLAPGGGDWATSLAVDSGGNVYVTGRSDGGETYYDYATVKYDASGNELWVARYNGPGNDEDSPNSLAVDDEGNVYVTGWSDSHTYTGTNNDYATIKYDASGNELWIVRYNGPGNSDDRATSLAVDGSGNVYVTGRSDGQVGSETNYDYATVKYDANGNQIWITRYDGPGNGPDEAQFLVANGGSNVYVTGKSDGQSGAGLNYDYATIKYDMSGNQIWEARYNGPLNFYDEAYSLAVDAGGNAYVTGRSNGNGTSYDYATIKYSGGSIANWLPVEATVLGQPLPQECRLEGNFPNPFNASTVLSYQLPVASQVGLRVYDTSGRLVETLVDGWRAAGEHELMWDAGDLPSGMYIYRLEAEDYSASGKMVLMK